MEYRIVSDRTELPRGTAFTTLPDLKKGDLALFELGGVREDWMIVGRWYPDVAGCDWILMPGLLIQCTGAVSVKVLGGGVPSEDQPKQITDLPESEYAHLFENPFPRTLDG
jgi:hypothetical protein